MVPVLIEQAKFETKNGPSVSISIQNQILHYSVYDMYEQVSVNHCIFVGLDC